MHTEKVIFIQNMKEYSNILRKKWIIASKYNNYRHDLKINDVMVFVILSMNNPKIIHATIENFSNTVKSSLIYFSIIEIDDFSKIITMDSCNKKNSDIKKIII